MKLSDYSDNLVAAVREKHDLSQEQLAHILGVSFSSVNAWESGKRCPSERMKELISFLGQKDHLPQMKSPALNFDQNKSTGLFRTDAGFVSSVLNYNGQRSILDYTHAIGRWYGCLPPFLVRDLIRFLITDYHITGPCLVNFSGSGTVALEFGLAGIGCTAIDTNPVALLLTLCKTKKIQLPSEHVLNSIFKKLQNSKEPKYDQLHCGANLLLSPNKWIEESAKKTFYKILHFVNNLKEESLKILISVSLINIAVDFCNIDKRCTNHYVFKQNFFSLPEFFLRLRKELLRVSDICRTMDSISNYHAANIRWGDATKLEFDNEQFSAIFSHPPYGNTINYFSISRIGLSMIALLNNNFGMWDKKNQSDVLLRAKQDDISSGTYSRFADLTTRWVSECYKVLRKNGVLLVIIGDYRELGKLQHPHTHVIKEAEKQGMVLREIFIWFTENKSGMHVKRKGNHIDHNYILIFQKI
jgi:putative transcriptional regulator